MVRVLTSGARTGPRRCSRRTCSAGRLISWLAALLWRARCLGRSRYDRPGTAAYKTLKNMSIEYLDDLRAKAQYARDRYQLYKAKAYGPRDTSPARLRELQRAYERAEARLRAAEEHRAPTGGASPPSSS